MQIYIFVCFLSYKPLPLYFGFDKVFLALWACLNTFYVYLFVCLVHVKHLVTNLPLQKYYKWTINGLMEEREHFNDTGGRASTRQGCPVGNKPPRLDSIPLQNQPICLYLKPCIAIAISDHPFSVEESPAKEQPQLQCARAQRTTNFHLLRSFCFSLRGNGRFLQQNFILLLTCKAILFR